MAITLETLLLQIEVNHQEMTAGLKRANKQVDNFTTKATKSFRLLQKAAIGVFALQFVRSAIRAASAMEQLEFRLKSSTGSAFAAAEAMKFLQETAARQNVSLIALSDGYVRLLPSVKSGALTMDEMREILALTNDNMKAFGISAIDAKRIFFGLSQLLGSGIVTMENLKQVTELLPGSLSAMAKATDRTLGSLIKWVSTGTVTAEMLKGPLLTAFKENEGAAQDMANSYDSATTSLQNTFNVLAKDSNLLGIATTGVKSLEEAMLALDVAAGVVGDSVKIVFSVFEEAGKLAGRLAFAITNPEDLILIDKQAAAIERFNKQLKRTGAIEAALARGREKTAESEGDVALEEKAALELKAKQDALKKEIELFKRKLLTEEELENSDFLKRQERLKVFLETEAITTQEADKLAIDLKFQHFMALEELDVEAKKAREDREKEHQEILQDLRDEGQNEAVKKTDLFLKRLKLLESTRGEERIRGTVTALRSVLSETTKHNKLLFDVNKGLALADVAVSTAQGIGRELSKGIIGIPTAAIIAAAGAAQIATIASTSFTGGGSGASGGGGAVASSSAGAAQDGGSAGGGGDRGLNIAIQGVDRDALFSGSQVRDILAAINDEIEDGSIIKGVNVV